MSKVRSIAAGACRSREGQVLPVILALMAVGGLVLAPTLDFLGTGLRSGSMIEQHIRELYAADAGVEHGMWTLKNSPPASYPYTYTLPAVNGLPVNVTLSVSNVLWGFSVGTSGTHSAWLLLHASMVWDASQGNYLFTVSLTNTANSDVHLDYIMVTPPSGYSYVPGSSYGITTADPSVAGDPNGDMGIIWDFATPRPDIPAAPNPGKGVYSTVYQYFRLDGPEGYAGSPGYIWVSAEREDIGTVSTATAMKVTAQAMHNGVAVSTASALVLVDNSTGNVLIGSWETN